MDKQVELLAKRLTDRVWRLESGVLYKIKDKEGNVVPFFPNESQRDLHRRQWYRNIILKARQLGFSTDIEIQALDYALFNENVNVWVIAHDLESAKKIFRDKVKFAWDNLPEWMKAHYSVKTDSVNEMSFSNGSTISVRTSFRSGTIQFLHISEFGKICAKYPDRAKEIVTGAIEAVPQWGFIFIESTAEGNEWYFFDMTMESKANMESEKELNKYDYKFHFYPWHDDERYVLNDPSVVISQQQEDYFQMLEDKYDIKVSDEQKRWYVKKEDILGKDMHREYPSYPEEAFNVMLEWVYYEKEMTLARKQKRLCKVPYDDNLPVYTAWDLWWAGWWDETAIRFYQLYGKEVRVIDYREWTGNSLSEIVYTVLKPRWYRIEINYLPHDAVVVELGTGKSRVEVLEDLWLECEVVPKLSIADGIQAVRELFPSMWIDEEKCKQWIKCLQAYRREWDDKWGTFKQRPLHDWSSHGADAMRYLAVSLQDELHSDIYDRAVTSNWM